MNILSPEINNFSNKDIASLPLTQIGNGNGLNEKHFFNDEQIDYLKELQSILEYDGKDILQQAKRQNYRSVICQILMISLGLVTSYVSAISDIDSSSKTYITASLSLGNAFVSGMYSLLKFSKHSTQLFNSYQQLREKENRVNSAIINGYSNTNFELLVEQTNKTITQNEFYVSVQKPESCNKIRKPINSTIKRTSNNFSPPPTPGNSNSSTPNLSKDKEKEKKDEFIIEIKEELEGEFKDKIKEELQEKIKEEILKQFLLKKKELTEEIVTQVQFHNSDS